MWHSKIADNQIKNEKGLRWLVLACALLLPLAISVKAQSYNELWVFECPGDLICDPVNYGQVAQGKNGIYGTAKDGGADGYGPGGLFFFNQSTSTMTESVYSATGFYGGLTLASDNNFYGTTLLGGTYGDGTVFRVDASLNYTVLYSFNGTDGVNPFTAPVQGPDGNLYGVTGSGTTYRITLPAGTFKQLPKSIPNNYPTVPEATSGPLYLASDGNFYGTSVAGGKHKNGTIFQMTTSGKISVVYSFSGGTDGAAPYGPLTQGPGADTNLYGTTYDGGSNGCGAVFKLTLQGAFTPLHSFDACSGGTNNDGAYPQAGLVAARGQLYGTNCCGGANGWGTIFQITPGGTFTKLFDMGSPQANGEAPFATLMLGTDGALYGTTVVGGGVGGGDLFNVTFPDPIQILRVAGPIFVLPGVPVEILGNDLSHVVQVYFGSVQAEFQPGSDTYVTATVPTQAIDAPISVILDTGFQIQTESAMHILPLITNLDPPRGSIGSQVDIAGGGFAGATEVTFGKVKATSFTVVAPNLIQAIVPAGARSGKVEVTTPNGMATSQQRFVVR